MNTIDIPKLIQKGFHVTLGATANLLEVIQDPRKLESNLNSLQRDFDDITDELAEKGAITEVEARNFVDTLVSRQIKNTETEVTTVTTTATTVTETNVQADLQELTQQLADLRLELERLRQKDN